MSENQEIINPVYTKVFVPAMEGTNLVRCNKNTDVHRFIKSGKRYVIELPETKRILNVLCTGTGVLAADMRIKSEYINCKKNNDEEEYTFSYQYEYFDSIHYTSFDYREKCIVYISLDELF